MVLYLICMGQELTPAYSFTKIVPLTPTKLCKLKKDFSNNGIDLERRRQRSSTSGICMLKEKKIQL